MTLLLYSSLFLNGCNICNIQLFVGAVFTWQWPQEVDKLTLYIQESANIKYQSQTGKTVKVTESLGMLMLMLMESVCLNLFLKINQNVMWSIENVKVTFSLVTFKMNFSPAGRQFALRSAIRGLDGLRHSPHHRLRRDLHVSGQWEEPKGKGNHWEGCSCSMGTRCAFEWLCMIYQSE